jgi:competence protein ComEA
MRPLVARAVLGLALAVSPVALAGGHRHAALHGTANLNSADAEALELLPGVGEARAARIVTWRHAHPFKRVEDLARVPGFGRKTMARLRPYLSLAGPTTLAEEPALPAAPPPAAH